MIVGFVFDGDGGGQAHQTSSRLTLEAFRAAADPARFPEQIKDGLRPWQPMKLFIGGVRENEEWTVRVDSGEYSPVLGDSFQCLIAWVQPRKRRAAAIRAGVRHPSF